jgi:hypothetical protein
MTTTHEDFENEQAEIVNTVKSKEGRSEGSGGEEGRWSKFNEELACRVVKQYMKKHLPTRIRVIGPNAYIEGSPTELDLLLVTENAIPAAFTNAYRPDDVKFVIGVRSQGSSDREFPSKLLLEFETLRERHTELKFAYLAIRAARNHKEDTAASHDRQLSKFLESGYRAFFLAESERQEIIPGQWRQFVNHVTENASA